ncbi:hypothetical protein VMCG_07862 [Cytospora schulzeri]|uniref:Alcohol dehydrogenase-like C-terminal domain-containing protein n=1 Tax=Cytospora schulzeri TaxID=448051 RepID=A0A423W0F5_9PEZI|nr:hypothetical protein VMCG_07862 [Valsa malicola]
MLPNETLIYKQYTPYAPTPTSVTRCALPGEESGSYSIPLGRGRTRRRHDPRHRTEIRQSHHVQGRRHGPRHGRRGGVDVYYDNVGGEQLEVALTRMKDFGQVISSGMVAVYNYPDEENYGIRSGMNIFLKRLSIKRLRLLGPTSYGKGKIKTKEEVVVGIDNAPEALVRMWNGDRFGKMVIQIDED